MNLKKFVVAGALLSCVAFAQTESPAPAAPAATVTAAPAADSSSATAASAAAPAADSSAATAASAAPAADSSVATAASAAPAADSSASPDSVSVSNAEEDKSQSAPKGKFDILHGSAYNSVGNEAAADNVDGFLGRPDKFAGNKFFYIEPSAERGVLSFGNIFAALDISGNIGRATVGYAMDGFGIALKAGIGRSHVDADDGEKFHTSAGDDLGLVASKVLKGYAFVFNADWLTYAPEDGEDPEFGASSDQKYRDLKVSLAVTNAPKAQKLFWTGAVDINYHLEESELGGKVAGDSANSYTNVTPRFNVGFLGLSSEHARVFAGLNASVPLYVHEKYDVVDANGDKAEKSLNEFGLVLSPNVLGEVILNDYVMFFGQASYDWLAFNYASGSDFVGDYTVLESDMDEVNASIGVRLQYHDFVACEFALGDSFFTDTKSIFNGEGVFVSFGAFLYF